jgi:hypothetical protein
VVNHAGKRGRRADQAAGQANLWQLESSHIQHSDMQHGTFRALAGLPACLPPCLPPCLPACLCSGQFAEVLNLVPWGGVSLQFRHLRLFGMQGVSGLGESPLSSCCIPLRCTTRAGGQAAHCWGRADVMHAFYLCLQAPRWHLPMWRTLPDFRHTAL